jgi:hypothetical protein
VYGAALGLVLFFIHQAGPISGALNPPPGYEPAWGVRNLDLPQYLTWLTAARTSAILPNYHAPWLTEPALFQPLFIAASRIPLPPMAAYYVFSAALYICAGIALIYAATVFCPGLEGYALLASACAVPLNLLLFGIGKIFHSLLLLALGLSGIVDYSYNSADGLFRGGLGVSLTLTAGTALMLLFMALLAQYVKTAQAPERGAAAKRGPRAPGASLMVVTFAAAFFHPFEIFVMVAASVLPLKQCGRIRMWIGIAAAGLLGMAPYLAASARSEWLRDLAATIPDAMYPFWVPENFGIPFVLLSYFLLIRFRMADAGDRILQSWFLAAIALALIPKFTLASHLFDGFAYCVGFLLVRRLAGDRKLLPAIERHRRGVTWTVAALASVSAVSLFLLYQQIWRDGRRAEPQWLLTAVRPVSERPLLEWLRSHATPNTLVLSPPDLAPWIATVPIHSFASHDLFSITYADQLKLANAFFRGDNVDRELQENYGVGIAVVPSNSPAIARLPAAAYQASVGTWRIYEFPQARMKPYPGLAALKPAIAPSPRARILEWLARLHGR